VIRRWLFERVGYLSTASIPTELGKGELLLKFYLTDFSLVDKPWDRHRNCADQVADLYSEADVDSYSTRINRCAQILLFGSPLDVQGQRKIRLKSAFFCRVRNCPVCQWRRSLMWKARLGQALPLIERDYPKIRWLHLTLTVRNCLITDLRDTLKSMNSAWQRLTQLKKFPAIGFFKSLEVTRGKDGSAHPHFHILLMVPNSYFQGANYIKQDKWIQMWKKALRIDYDPGAHIQAIKVLGNNDNILDAVKEVAKYTVKGDDLIVDNEWLAEYTKQVHKTRAISLGGILKTYLSDTEATNEELVLGESTEELNQLVAPYYLANWDKPDARYTARQLDD
jgi:plasmid rolling circle replication initiator protein Rep